MAVARSAWAEHCICHAVRDICTDTCDAFSSLVSAESLGIRVASRRCCGDTFSEGAASRAAAEAARSFDSIAARSPERALSQSDLGGPRPPPRGPRAGASAEPARRRQVPTISEAERTQYTKDLTAADSFSREELGPPPRARPPPCPPRRGL